MDLPIRINNGAGAQYKQYGVHTGSIGRISGVEVHAGDAQKLKNNLSAEVTLDHLPNKFFIKVQGKITKPFPGLDVGELPMAPRSTRWNLYESMDTK
eukprot:11494794-Karenia_brevis.AAC.1